MAESVVTSDKVREFLESILEEAHMSSFDTEIHEGMLQELYSLLDNYLAAAVVDHLNPEDLEVFIKMNEDNKSADELELFLKEKMPDHQEIFSNAFLEFKTLYLEDVTAKRKEAHTQ